MIFKTGVVVWNIHPKIEELLADGGFLDQVFWRMAARQCIITSCRDGRHSTKSWHYKGRAVDLRTNDLPEATTLRIELALREELDHEFDVLLEGLGTSNEHIHIEFDPH